MMLDVSQYKTRKVDKEDKARGEQQTKAPPKNILKSTAL